MAFPTFEQTLVSFSDSNVGSLAVSLAFTASAVDDIEIVSWCNDGDSTPSIGGTGWNEITALDGGGNSNITIRVWWRRVDSGNVGDTSVTVTISGGNESCAAHAYRITGAETTGTVVESGTPPALASNETPDAPSLNPTNWDTEDTLWIVTAWAKRGQTANPVDAYPTNYDDNQTATNTGGSNGMTMATCSRNLNAASEDPGVIDWAFTRQTTITTLAVRPAAAAAPIILPVYPVIDKRRLRM